MTKSEAKRLIKQRAIEIDGKVIDSVNNDVEIREGSIIKIGKRKFIRIHIEDE